MIILTEKHEQYKQYYLNFWDKFSDKILTLQSKWKKEEAIKGESCLMLNMTKLWATVDLLSYISLETQRVGASRDWAYYVDKYDLKCVKKQIDCLGLVFDDILYAFGLPLINHIEVDGIGTMEIGSTFEIAPFEDSESETISTEGEITAGYNCTLAVINGITVEENVTGCANTVLDAGLLYVTGSYIFYILDVYGQGGETNFSYHYNIYTYIDDELVLTREFDSDSNFVELDSGLNEQYVSCIATCKNNSNISYALQRDRTSEDNYYFQKIVLYNSNYDSKIKSIDVGSTIQARYGEEFKFFVLGSTIYMDVKYVNNINTPYSKTNVKGYVAYAALYDDFNVSIEYTFYLKIIPVGGVIPQDNFIGLSANVFVHYPHKFEIVQSGDFTPCEGVAYTINLVDAYYTTGVKWYKSGILYAEDTNTINAVADESHTYWAEIDIQDEDAGITRRFKTEKLFVHARTIAVDDLVMGMTLQLRGEEYVPVYIPQDDNKLSTLGGYKVADDYYFCSNLSGIYWTNINENQFASYSFSNTIIDINTNAPNGQVFITGSDNWYMKGIEEGDSSHAACESEIAQSVVRFVPISGKVIKNSFNGAYSEEDLYMLSLSQVGEDFKVTFDGSDYMFPSEGLYLSDLNDTNTYYAIASDEDAAGLDLTPKKWFKYNTDNNLWEDLNQDDLSEITITGGGLYAVKCTAVGILQTYNDIYITFIYSNFDIDQLT